MGPMELANKKILVVGLGKTGVSCAKFLRQKDAVVAATDTSKELEGNTEIQSLIDLGVTVEIGDHKPEPFERADLILLSPGVPHTLAPVKKAMEKGIPVMGEIEMASRFIKEPIIAVTGTNGKTTTTTLLGEMLRQCGYQVYVGGNIGNPLIDYAGDNEKADIIVAEISSFQLDTIQLFRPDVAVLLNITEDHLDRYSDFNAYARSKFRIFENQIKKDIAILNGSDSVIQSLCHGIKSKKVFFDDAENPASGILSAQALISKKDIRFYMDERTSRSLDISRIKLPGYHNLQNIAAACLAVQAMGGAFDKMERAIYEFKGLPHRLEYVNTVNGVHYYDDSKGTNADAVEKALNAFNKPVVLIMGGRNKEVDFRTLEKSVRRHVKKLIIIGEAAEEIKTALGHITETEPAGGMDEAVLRAHQSATSGDIVLLSPACASFDMYKNYAERGKHFCEAVSRLGE